jgi:hypothetical protein
MFGGNNPPTGTGSFTSTTKPSGNESKIDIYKCKIKSKQCVVLLWVKYVVNFVVNDTGHGLSIDTIHPPVKCYKNTDNHHIDHNLSHNSTINIEMKYICIMYVFLK